MLICVKDNSIWLPKGSSEFGRVPSRIITKRLLLDAVTESDTKKIVELAGDFDVARGTLGIPHPYGHSDAESWIRGIPEEEQGGKSVTWAIRRIENSDMIGCVTLFVFAKHGRAEIGFWVGRPEWGKGIATEAARAVIGFGFSNFALRRIDGSHFEWNAASSRVLTKLGFVQEGQRRDFVKRFDRFESLVVYGLMADSFEDLAH
jgi:ribosomal-protein-alanine N-acetyltransferase